MISNYEGDFLDLNRLTYCTINSKAEGSNGFDFTELAMQCVCTTELEKGTRLS